MSLKLVREFADRIADVLDDKQRPDDWVYANMHSGDKLAKIKAHIASLRGWLSNLEAQAREVDRPREAMWQRFLQIVEDIQKAQPHTGSSRDIGYYSTDNRRLLSTLSMHKPNGEEVYYIIEVGYRDGKTTETVKMTEKRRSYFWDEIASQKDHRYIIVDHRLYEVGTKTQPSNHNGFAGSWFYVQFDDGELLETCDLWSRGTVPPLYRKRLKNNAKFLKQEEFKAASQVQA